MHNASELVERLTDARAGKVLHPGGAGWSEVAPLYAASGEPMMVIRPTDSLQVSIAVRFAAMESLELSVRSGGHLAMAFPNGGGLVIDLCELRGIDVDGTRVGVGGGAVWGDVARELGRHGLALTSGDTKSVGVGGLSLGGGIGWM
ncbi:MAG: FAD-binding protein, partial [Rhodoglobus sp.]